MPERCAHKRVTGNTNVASIERDDMTIGESLGQPVIHAVIN